MAKHTIPLVCLLLQTITDDDQAVCEALGITDCQLDSCIYYQPGRDVARIAEAVQELSEKAAWTAEEMSRLLEL